MKKRIGVLAILICLISISAFNAYASTDTELDDFVGTYRGWYYANQGHTGLTLDVYQKENGDYEASFKFYSVPENPSVPSGEYICGVSYNASQNSYYIEGIEWVKKPSGYSFVDLEGNLTDNLYKGRVLASSRTFNFELTKQVGANATSNWADENVNTAIVESFVPLELQSDYKSNITRADFARLTIAAISLKTEMSIEAFMLSRKLAISSTPFDDTEDIFVTYANSLGIVNGYGNKKFGPNDPITREQAATMLRNLAHVFKEKTEIANLVTYSDENLFSPWALKGIDFVSNFQSSETQIPIMSGYNNRFDPKGGYTREQAIVTIYRLIDSLQ